MTLALQLSHFSAAVTFSLFSSIVFGICFRGTPRDMFRYGAYCFMVFVVGLLSAGWAMRFLHR
jgi:hypothetical protein